MTQSKLIMIIAQSFTSGLIAFVMFYIIGNRPLFFFLMFVEILLVGFVFERLSKKS